MDVDALIGQLTLDEKARLLAGADLWSTAAVDRLRIPAFRLTDGPSGARGLPGPDGRVPPTTCIPCGSALGATWDAPLVQRLGELLGDQARERGCDVLLAPTVNLHRSPLAGRNFECYSEDPVISGQLAAAFVRGVQAQGVIATVKHFVGNESEHQRMTMSSEISERALRELYLLPFEMAIGDGGARAVMTAYNKVNGVYCAEHVELVRDVLRGEWGFDGIVMTDWWARATTAGAATATVDLEMPGPGRAYGSSLAAAVDDGRLPEVIIDESVRRLLSVLDRDRPHRRATPTSTADKSALVRAAATGSIVLLKNSGGLLPLTPSPGTSVALIGPSSDRVTVVGGGSASVTPEHEASLAHSLRARLPSDVVVVHEPGGDISRWTPLLPAGAITTPDGRPGVLAETFEGGGFDGTPTSAGVHPTTEFSRLTGQTEPRLTGALLRCTYTPTCSGVHTFGLAQAGRARLIIDGAVAIDGVTRPPPPGATFLGAGSDELTADVQLTAGIAVNVVAELTNVDAPLLCGVRVGCRPPEPTDANDRAVRAAERADAAIVVVGTTAEWESEGFDRDSMRLPGTQDELVKRVIAANPRTVVVVNCGSAIEMPWADDAAAILQVWFGGQEMADAIVDVLLGEADPGGRLPVTIPLRLEDTPSYGNFPADNGVCNYREDILVGYRWYDARDLPVRFPFGHGLSYTQFRFGEPVVTTPSAAGEPVVVDVPVTNVGPVKGSDVVQCYVAPAPARQPRPRKELKAFAKVHLEPGATEVVRLVLDDRAFAYWDDTDDERHGWVVEPGVHELHVGHSSVDIEHVLSVNR